jgi:TrmH family RNA methyltransferase
MPTEITSVQNQRIKQLAKLSKRRVRDVQRVTIVEGLRECERALRQGVKPREAYLCPDLLSGDESQRLGRMLEEMAARSQLHLFHVTPEVFARLAYRAESGGVVLVVPYLPTALDALHVVPNALYAVIEGVEKPGNLGAILRTADAAGVDAVIVCRAPGQPATDLHNPNVVRASLGALFSVSLAESTSRETIAWLQQRNIKIATATPDATQPYTDADLTGSVAVVLGSEATGLSDAWLAAADVQVTIPMHGIVDSLNLATSTALLLYEVVRQRR